MENQVFTEDTQEEDISIAREEGEKEIDKLLKNIEELKKFATDKEMISSVKKVNKFLNKNTKSCSLPKVIEFFSTCQTSKGKKKIRVQARSVQRRVASGCTINQYLKTRGIQKIKARKHSLKEAIQKNQQNSGKFWIRVMNYYLLDVYELFSILFLIKTYSNCMI